MARDPVCGMTVEAANAAAHCELHGVTYFCCSKGCAQKFAANPERHLRQSSAPSMGASANFSSIETEAVRAQPLGQKQLRYTCPMHPEIIQIGPGSCPKCGMALEPMDILAEET